MMDDNEAVELLNVHAENLSEHLDLAELLLEAKRPEEQTALKPLMALARRLHAALVPVQPRPDFLRSLRAQLGVQRASVSEAVEERNRRWLWFAAGLTGLAYMIGLTLVGLRISLTLAALVVGILGWKMARPGLPKPRILGM